MAYRKAKIKNVNPIIEIFYECPYCKKINNIEWIDYGIEEEDCFYCDHTVILEVFEN